jgi:hypothetical protein
MMWNIFELLYNNDHVVVWSNNFKGLLYTWDQELSFYRWEEVPARMSGDSSGYNRQGWKIYRGFFPLTLKRAQRFAKEWDTIIFSRG